MGIQGLMKYITENPRFSEPYELHGGYLVIDGISLMYKIYAHSRCRSAFGGDHDEFAQATSEFFDDLAKCEVTPLVIFHGGREQRKDKKERDRMKAALQTAKHYSPSSKNLFFPISLMLSYKDILLKKSIKMAYTVFHADPIMVGIAQALNCPVLSDESGFYIHGASFILIHTLERFIVKKNDIYVRRCRIYKRKNLLKNFPGLNTDVLPLLGILQCNDHTVDKVFEGFLESLNMPPNSWNKIDMILHWLKNRDLNGAATEILSELPKKLRHRAISMIELGVNDFLNTPCELLVPLGFEDVYHKHKSTESCQKPYKFEGDTNALQSRRHSWRSMPVVTSEDSSSEEEIYEYEKKYTNPKIEKDWPSWFYRRFSRGELSSDCLSFMDSRMCSSWAHVEDFNYRCPIAMSFKILQVIDGLLVSGRTDEIPAMTFIARDGNDYKIHQFDKVLEGTPTVKFPNLAQLEDTEMEVKKRIVDDTLGIADREHLFQDLPTKWRLYIATMFFWMKSDEEPPRNSRHLYAMLLAMLIGIIDQKIGYHRSQYSFTRSFGQKISDTLSERKLSRSKNPENVIEKSSIIEALDAVTEEDCLIAAPFFISRRSTRQILIESPQEFDVTIVHVFAQFQYCCDAAMALNALLNYPYERPNISEFFNGTLLYNVYSDFQKQTDVESFIATNLENSPSLLNLVQLLIAKMKNMCENIVTV
ncbi:protein asteroid-like [Venturia canescens]|uniref:protein asteroid-like n=1 Tax=Venturia canescens TaxID=32260 RepID=UPI001C9D6166|nr:protein asteroid-like [Venturia canescens]XP_043270558.1 protein asteroid-like [Venturia canescens]XP_043270559.1 protein asteroid-like [Venturia canescens]